MGHFADILSSHAGRAFSLCDSYYLYGTHPDILTSQPVKLKSILRFILFATLIAVKTTWTLLALKQERFEI